MHDPHHVYLDLDDINDDYTHDGAPPYLRFAVIRNTPYLDGDCSKYFCSIMRFYDSDWKYATGLTPSCRHSE